MAKREDLLKQLRQAERRRQRRPAPTASATNPARASNQLADQLASTLLDLYEKHPSLTDRQVLAAANAILNERPNSDPNIRLVQDALAAPQAPSPVDRKLWYRELQTLIESIRRDFNGGSGQGYLEFLRTLAN